MLTILAEQETDPSDAVYIGDSLMKDIVIAQAVGVLDVHARYGVVQHKEEYELLRRVSHWPQVDVARERVLAESDTHVVPSLVCRSSFAEVLPAFGMALVEAR